MKATPPMSRSLSLSEIRSEACNKTLVAYSIVAFPALFISLTRAFEQGWQPVMYIQVLLIIGLAIVTVRRHHLSLNIRAGFLTAVLFALGLAGMLTYGLGTGAMMFFISSSIFAACFFAQGIGFILVGIASAAVLAVFLARSFGLLPNAIDPIVYSTDITSWISACAALLFCASGPIFALTAVNRALDAERTRADAAANARSQFLARMSHELRTPMTGVIGMAELLQSTPLTREQGSMITRLLRAAQNLLGLLNDVLDFAKVDAGRIVIESAPFRISDVVGEITDLFSLAAAERKLTIRTHLPDHYADAVIGDRFRLGQVLSNLVSNALKFTSTGHVDIHVSQATQADGQLQTTFAITDTGIGISPEELTRLFQPFVQADSSTTRKYGGSGLGLVISQSLVQAMGGEIHVKSVTDQGSTFTVTLPLKVDPANTPLPEPIVAPRATPPLMDAAQPLRILLAEDDALVSSLIVAVLKGTGAEITAVADGAQAVQAAQHGSFDIIIVDMHMPVMDGIEATRQIRAQETNRTPLIALTADVLRHSKDAFLAAGADTVVPKPISWRQLDAEIKRLTQKA